MMTIGSHELRGKLVTLQQPFVVLKKKKRKQKREAASAINNDNAVTDEVCVSLEGERIKESNARDDSFPAAASCQTEYEIWAVIRKKMMFDEYPAAIMR